MPDEQQVFNLLQQLVNMGGHTIIWAGGLYVLAKYGTPVVTAGIVLRGVRLIIREVARARRGDDGPR